MNSERDNNNQRSENTSIPKKLEIIMRKISSKICVQKKLETEEEKTLKFCRHFDDTQKEWWGLGFSKY